MSRDTSLRVKDMPAIKFEVKADIQEAVASVIANMPKQGYPPNIINQFVHVTNDHALSLSGTTPAHAAITFADNSTVAYRVTNMVDPRIVRVIGVYALVKCSTSGDMYANFRVRAGGEGEAYDAIDNTIASTTWAITANVRVDLDITASFDGVEGGDLFSLVMERVGGNAADTLNANAYLMGIYIVGTTEASDIPYEEPEFPNLNGFSGYPHDQYTGGIWTPSAFDEIFDAMDEFGVKCYRISFNPYDRPTWSRPYDLGAVQYFLNNRPTDNVIIIDCNHYVSPTLPTSTSGMIQRCLEVYNAFGNNPRVIIEPFNEMAWGYPVFDRAQEILDALRLAGYTGYFLVTKFDPYFLEGEREPWELLTDAEDKVIYGFHIYMNQLPFDPETGLHGLSFEDVITYAQAAGITRFVSTEMGAHTLERTSFTDALVADTNDALIALAAEGFYAQIWLNKGVYNLEDGTASSGYRTRGLTFP